MSTRLSAYRIYAALERDLETSNIWTNDPRVRGRVVVKIVRPEFNKQVYCEALEADRNFVRQYSKGDTSTLREDEKFIVMNGWYRAGLALETQSSPVDLELTIENHLCGKIAASLMHPQTAIRIGVILGIVAVGLGILGLLLGVAGIIIAWHK